MTAFQYGREKLISARLLLFVTAVFSTTAFFLNIECLAQGWSEYRTVEMNEGEEISVEIGDTAVLTSGDSQLIVRTVGGAIVFNAPEAGNYTLNFDREILGPLEINLEVKGPSDTKQGRSLFSTIRDKISTPSESKREAAPSSSRDMKKENEPVRLPKSEKVRKPAADPAVVSSSLPPIMAPPKPHVLRTPRGVSEDLSASPVLSGPEFAEMESEEIPLVDEPEEISEEFTLPTPSIDGDQKVTEITVPTGSETQNLESDEPEEVFATLDEMSIYALATDLMNRKLYNDSIKEFQRLLEMFPRTKLRQNALERIGFSHKNQADIYEKEANRQRDLRKSGEANAAIDAAILSYGSAVGSYRAAMDEAQGERERGRIQLNVAQSLHGVVRSNYFKGNSSEDSPGVVVEYLKSFIASEDTAIAAPARLGIAKYYRDLGNVRHQADPKDVFDAKIAYERAIEEYMMVFEASPYSSAAEEALIDLGRLYDQNLIVRQFEKAVWYYDEVVRRFPGGVFATEARDRAQTIKKSYL